MYDDEEVDWDETDESEANPVEKELPDDWDPDEKYGGLPDTPENGPSELPDDCEEKGGLQEIEGTCPDWNESKSFFEEKEFLLKLLKDPEPEQIEELNKENIEDTNKLNTEYSKTNSSPTIDIFIKKYTLEHPDATQNQIVGVLANKGIEINRKPVTNCWAELRRDLMEREDNDFLPYIKEPINQFEVLKDENLIKIIENYNSIPEHKEKNIIANQGTRLRNDFSDFVEKSEKLTIEQKRELLEKIDQINREKIVDNLVKYYIENYHEKRYIGLEKNEIAQIVSSQGYKITTMPVKRCHKELVRDRALNEMEDRNYIPDLQPLFEWSHSETGTYPNTGVIIGNGYLKFVEKNYEKYLKYMEKRGLSTPDKETTLNMLHMVNKNQSVNDIIFDYLEKTNFNFLQTEKMLKESKIKIGNSQIGKNVYKNLFYRNSYGILECRSVQLLKAQYEKNKNIKQVESFLKSKGYKTMPSIEELETFIRDTFESDIDYEDWIKIIEWKDNITLESSVKLLNEVVQPRMREHFGLEDKEAPTFDNFQNFKILGNETLFFPRILIKNGLNYNQIVFEGGFKVNRVSSSAMSESCKSFFENPNLETATEYFREIYPKLKEEFNLPVGSAPRIHEHILESEFKHFYHKMKVNNLSYINITENIGLEPNYHDVMVEVGSNAHACLERIALQHTRDLGCESFAEPYVSKNDNLKRPDFCVMRNENFVNIIESNQTVLELINPQVKIISVDFYQGNPKNVITLKTNKGYQGSEKMLILVPIGAPGDLHQEMPENLNVPFVENVKIMNPKEFGEFLGIKGDLLSELDSVIAHSNRTQDRESRDKLAEMAIKSRGVVDTRYPYKNESFQNYITQNKLNHLLNSELLPEQEQVTLDAYIDGNTPLTREDQVHLKIDQIGTSLNLNSKIKDNADEIINRALENGHKIVPNKTSFDGLAGAALYLSCKENNVKITQKQICEHAKIKTTSFSLRIKKMRELS